MHFSSYKDILLGLQYRLKKEFIGITLLRKLGALIALIFLFVPNLIAQALLGRVRQILGGRVDFAISGAGALPEYIDRFFYSIGVPIVETYGMTETVGVSARRKYPGTVIGTVGATFPGVEIKLVDGVTGADWSGIWVERGNSRILWLAHGPRNLIPAYAVSDPARAAKELAESEVPVQWRRLEASFAQASPVEKAAAAERLFIEPAAEAFAQPAGDNSSLLSAPVAELDRPALRKRLDRVPDSDLVALCLDYFPDVFREFSAGMLKTQKITLLLQMVDPGRVAAALGTTRW
jgi:acyl-CoA synthetase (AMP-forming)/AMP-acid ligase II